MVQLERTILKVNAKSNIFWLNTSLRVTKARVENIGLKGICKVLKTIVYIFTAVHRTRTRIIQFIFCLNVQTFLPNPEYQSCSFISLTPFSHTLLYIYRLYMHSFFSIIPNSLHALEISKFISLTFILLLKSKRIDPFWYLHLGIWQICQMQHVQNRTFCSSTLYIPFSLFS